MSSSKCCGKSKECICAQEALCSCGSKVWFSQWRFNYMVNLMIKNRKLDIAAVKDQKLKTSYLALHIPVPVAKEILVNVLALVLR